MREAEFILRIFARKKSQLGTVDTMGSLHLQIAVSALHVQLRCRIRTQELLAIPAIIESPAAGRVGKQPHPVGVTGPFNVDDGVRKCRFLSGSTLCRFIILDNRWVINCDSEVNQIIGVIIQLLYQESLHRRNFAGKPGWGGSQFFWNSHVLSRSISKCFARTSC